MTRKGEFVLRQLADEYILIPYGTTTEKMNRVLTLSETAAFIYEQTGDAASEEEIARRLGEAYDVPAEDGSRRMWWTMFMLRLSEPAFGFPMERYTSITSASKHA